MNAEEIHKWLTALKSQGVGVSISLPLGGGGMQSKYLSMPEFTAMHDYVSKLERAIVMLIFKQSELESK